ncbi:MAG: D-threo-aldose 1-dehydrogenase [Actinomycetota bacterium]|nr:D-threo-aldose 1-dehydrogenase [Actinomycetota bacterium]
MRTRRVAATGVELTQLGFGSSAIGNMYRAVDDNTAQAALEAAWDAGIRYFDTAPYYGLGVAEQRLGRFLTGRPRQEFVVSSKVGRLLEPSHHPTARGDTIFDVPGDMRPVRDYSRDGVLRSIEATMQRTGLDRFDVILVHDPDDHWRQAVDEAMPTLTDLRDQGVIGAIGVGMNQSGMLERFLRETAADVVMLAGRYTLLEQGALNDVLPAAAELGKSVIIAGAFNSGLLAQERPEADAKYDYLDAPSDVVERARRLADICQEHATTLPAAAIAFPLGHPSVINVVLGMGAPEEVTRNATMYADTVPAELWEHLRAEDLLHPDAPTPHETLTPRG